jgi:hypothetical protein
MGAYSDIILQAFPCLDDDIRELLKSRHLVPESIGFAQRKVYKER